jgi:hypothetical protein
MQDFERLGVFYLGRAWDAEKAAPTDQLVLYDSRDLTTHAVCVGMTGSGKTGLCLSLLEEAALDGIPAIAVDPKGDLANLFLTFPDLAPADFRPWVDEAEAARLGLSADEHAARVAETWRQGLADSGQDGARIARLRAAVDLALYTPGSTAGRPLSVLASFAAPPAAVAADEDALRERVLAVVSGLIALVGLPVDPLRSREHILLSTLLDRDWRGGRSPSLAELVRSIQSPPFDRVGALDLEAFFPARERAELAQTLNGLLAAPGFAAWMQGELLDVQRLLWTAEGKPRLSIVSIAHLGDAERMFFVTALLGEIVAWMRVQPGTPSLRAILYMDEVLGFFPPVAVPPSKPPMLTLLKQARAFGLGVVLATQNPADLDYKGLSNAGTWLVGRLQTERDRSRLLEGLTGSTTAGSRLDRAKLGATLAGLGNRVFLMHDVHEDAPVVFRSRWAMSYLRGPLTRAQIASLAGSSSRLQAPGPESTPARSGPEGEGELVSQRPAIPPEAAEAFVAGATAVYRAALLGRARLRFVSAKAGVDLWEEITLLAPLDEGSAADPWERAEAVPGGAPVLQPQPEPGASFERPPAAALRPKSYAAWAESLADTLYRTRTLRLWSHPPLRRISKHGESEGDFRARLAQLERERRDEAVERLRARFAPKLASLDERIRRAEERVAREQAQYEQQKTQTLVSVGATLLGAVLGRRTFSAGSLGRATTAARGMSRSAKEKDDIASARESVDALRQARAELDAAFRAEATAVGGVAEPSTLTLDTIEIRPRKADVGVTSVSLVWTR